MHDLNRNDWGLSGWTPFLWQLRASREATSCIIDFDGHWKPAAHALMEIFLPPPEQLRKGEDHE